jgi:hypothetical protein
MRAAGVLALIAVGYACGGSQPSGDAVPPGQDAAKVAESPAQTGATSVSAPAPSLDAARDALSDSRRAAEPPAPAFREVTLPAGTTLQLELKSAVGSDSSNVEDAVRGELRSAVTVDGQRVLPAGTEIVGSVTDVERAGRVKGRARVAFRFDSLRHQGERYDIRTAPIARQAEATKSEDATKIAVGAGAGAALGAILGGGDGAAKGAAIGGAGGTGVVLATRGKEVRLGPGADVTTRLTAPLTLRVRG